MSLACVARRHPAHPESGREPPAASATLGCRTYATRECEDGRCYDTTAPFRAYKNAAASFADHGYFLTVNDIYDKAFRYSSDPNRFAREIHKAGYATEKK